MQAPPAVGRALGNSLAHAINVPSKFPKNFVSLVSVGDGSVNHAHFLSAVNMAEYAAFRGYKVPVVFAVSDNDISISLRGYDWLCSEFVKKLRMPVHFADGNNLLDMWAETRKAVDYSRKNKKPAAIIYQDVPRRFGHAATDRQSAYMSPDEIASVAAENPLAHACAQLVEAGVATYPQLLSMWDDLAARTRAAFAKVCVACVCALCECVGYANSGLALSMSDDTGCTFLVEVEAGMSLSSIPGCVCVVVMCWSLAHLRCPKRGPPTPART